MLKKRDNNDPPELVIPCTIPVKNKYINLKFELKFIKLFFLLVNNIDEIITIETMYFKLIKFSKFLKIRRPKNIEGMQIKKKIFLKFLSIFALFFLEKKLK